VDANDQFESASEDEESPEFIKLHKKKLLEWVTEADFSKDM